MGGETDDISSTGDLPSSLTRPQRRILYALGLALGLLAVLTIIRPGARHALAVAFTQQRTVISLLLLFSLVMLSLVWSSGQTLDSLVFLRFNLHGHRPLWMDRTMWVMTQLGNFFTALLLSGIVYLLGNHRLSFDIIFGMITLWFVVELIKALTERTRPYLIINEARVVGLKEKGNSFPSGHTSQTFFLMSLLIHLFRLSLWLSLVLYAIAVLVGITRMYVGAHYPRDVLAGAFLGTVWGILTTLVDMYLAGHPVF